MKPKLWDGSDLSGNWYITRKLDGIRCLVDANGCATSYRNKPLYGIPLMPEGDYEVYCDGGFDETVKILRTHRPHRTVRPDEMYELHSDKRLLLDYVVNPTAEYLKTLLEERVALGEEGLVLRQDNKWIKVKKFETFDVKVLSYEEGAGKYIGKLGAVVTEMGKVGTGFTDKQREEFWQNGMTDIIEVECMELTPAGKFRHPRFKRERIDK